ncbi:MAG: biopolymer transporter ExbD [Rhodospirillaceae bacterium]|nr:biopolymer transporter ExbD [Rhodospirillaceae bacterium]
MRLRRRDNDDHLESAHGIDLAPMLDFVINLLIFFIITAVFVKEAGLIVNRPTSFETPPDNEDIKSIQIQILANDEIWIDGRAVDARAVRANVERQKAVSPESGVLIIADENSATETMVKVVDQVHLGGIYNVTFSTQN